MKFHLTSLGFYGINSDNRVTKSSCLDLEHGPKLPFVSKVQSTCVTSLRNKRKFVCLTIIDWFLVSGEFHARNFKIVKNHFIQYNYVTTSMIFQSSSIDCEYFLPKKGKKHINTRRKEE